MKKLKILAIFAFFLLFATAAIYSTIEPVFRLWDAIDRDDEKTILSLKGNKFALGFPTVSGTSPLLYAMECKSQHAFLALLECGEDPNKFLSRGRIVTSIAAANKDPYWLRQVLEHGGDPNVLNSHAREWRQGYPLNFAINSRMLVNAKMLIEKGANPNSHGATIQSPLAQATATNQFEVALILLDNGADPKLREVNGMSFVWAIYGKKPTLFRIAHDREKLQVLLTRLRDMGIDPYKHHREGEYFVFDDLDEEAKKEKGEK